MFRGSERGGVSAEGLLIVWVTRGSMGRYFWVWGLKTSGQKIGDGEDGKVFLFGGRGRGGGEMGRGFGFEKRVRPPVEPMGRLLGGGDGCWGRWSESLSEDGGL